MFKFESAESRETPRVAKKTDWHRGHMERPLDDDPAPKSEFTHSHPSVSTPDMSASSSSPEANSPATLNAVRAAASLQRKPLAKKRKPRPQLQPHPSRAPAAATSATTPVKRAQFAAEPPKVIPSEGAPSFTVKKPVVVTEPKNAAWTGEGEAEMDFAIGDVVFMLNPYFRDGTRLRLGPTRDDPFSEQHILNDAEVEVLELSQENGFAKVGEVSGAMAEGWVRGRNLVRRKRGTGLGYQPPPAGRSLQARSLQRGTTIAQIQQGPSTAKGPGLAAGSDGFGEDDELENKDKWTAAGLDKVMSISGGDQKIGGREMTRRRESLENTHSSIKQQLYNRKKCTLDPHSKGMQRWDSMMALGLLYTAIVTPFEVCVLLPVSLGEMLYDPLCWTNRVVDLFFVADVVIQCFLAYQEPPDKGGQWVHNNLKIFRRYAKSWMPLDILTALPIDVFVAVYENGLSSVNAGNAALRQGLRIVRMLRLLKLIRVLRASRIFRRWQAHFGLSFAMMALLKFMMLMLVTSHWLACAWLLTGKFVTPPEDEKMPDGMSSAHAFSTTWLHKAGLTKAGPAEQYGVSLYVALATITSGSVGVISPSNPLEYYVQTLMMLLGAAAWAYVISSGCGIIATLNPAQVEYRHMMDELNYFAKEKELPRDLTVKLREFLALTAHTFREKQYNQVLSHLSVRLRADAALCWAKSTLMRVPYFQSGSIEDEFLASVALGLKPQMFCRTEHISVVDGLVIIERGIAAKDGRISTKGACLGQDMVLTSLTFRDLDPAIALTFVVQTAMLEKKQLEALLVDYPHARRAVRSSSFKLAFSRAIVQVSKMMKMHSQMGLLEAFVAVRKEKQRAVMLLSERMLRLAEPSRNQVVSHLNELSERTDSIAKQGETRAERTEAMVKTLDAKLDAVIAALGAAYNAAPAPQSALSA